jgi:hypothetical protein
MASKKLNILRRQRTLSLSYAKKGMSANHASVSFGEEQEGDALWNPQRKRHELKNSLISNSDESQPVTNYTKAEKNPFFLTILITKYTRER